MPCEKEILKQIEDEYEDAEPISEDPVHIESEGPLTRVDPNWKPDPKYTK